MSRERWQELDQDATGNVWHVFVKDGEVEVWDLEEQAHVVTTGTDEDANFIAAARTAWPAAERECDQLRAERDQALTLLRQIRVTLDGYDRGTNEERTVRLITASGLLDDEGQQR